MSLLNNIKQVQALKLTENGAMSSSTSGSAIVDAFAMIGSMRGRDTDDIRRIYELALLEDPLLATKMAYYVRDARGGMGERDTGRIMLYLLAEKHPKTFIANLPMLVEVGRFDDLIEIMYTMNECNDKNEAYDAIVHFINKQLLEDYGLAKEDKPISLLAKWLPSINTSSYETKKKAKLIINALEMDNVTYRKTLSFLRKHLNVTEVNISAKDYEAIKYEEVSSNAMNKYRNAFYRNDESQFKAYLEDVKNGKRKINSGTLYPYEIVEKILYGNEESDVLEEQWKALPNYVDENKNFLIMADVSGSMSGRPMATSIGLAIYFAERNKGTFGNHFMTFSKSPKLVELKGKTLNDKIDFMKGADWGMNTDLEKAFYLVLDTAIKYNTPKEEMPTSIVVISDMEIDMATRNTGEGLFNHEMKEAFNKAGYDMPNLVFWNVEARNNTFHANATDENIQLISGSSVSAFSTLCENTYLSPLEFVKRTLNVQKYEEIIFVE